MVTLWNRINVKKIKDFKDIKEPIVKFALYLPQKNVSERIHNLTEIVRQKARIVDSGHYCIDIIPQNVSKGHAIEILMDKLDISADEIMAFGDAENDIEMLKKVKYGYVMENAKDFMKEQFQWIAPSFNDEGVLEVIEHYLKNDSFYNQK